MIIPQVVARIVPPMTNQAISIIKDTSQVAAIAVMDMMKMAQVWVESPPTPTMCSSALRSSTWC